jgi:hypothetical protein
MPCSVIFFLFLFRETLLLVLYEQDREGEPGGGGSHLLVEGGVGLRASWCENIPVLLPLAALSEL